MYTVDELPQEPPGPEGNRFTLPLVSSGYRTLGRDEDDQDGDENTVFALDFNAGNRADESGRPDPVHRISLVVEEGLQPRFRRGETYSVSYYQNHRGVFLDPAQGVVVRAAGGALLYLLTSDEAVPLSHLPEGLRISPTQRTAFRTTRGTQSGCFIQRRHLLVEASVTDGPRTVLAPGEKRTLRVSGTAYELVILDASVDEGAETCSVQAPAHFSYLLRSLDQEN